MDDDELRMIQILKDDSCGPSLDCLREKFGDGWLAVANCLINRGLARLDRGKNGRPDRMKALPAAWNVANLE